MASCETCQYAYIDEMTGEASCDGDEYKTVRHQI